MAEHEPKAEIPAAWSQQRGLEETGADAVGKIAEIDQREEVDGLEFPIDRRRTANPPGDIQIGAEQARRPLHFDGLPGGLAGVSRLRLGAKRSLDEMIFLKRLVHRGTVVLVLGRDGAATDEVARIVARGVNGDAFPEGVKNHNVTVILVNAGAPKLEHLLAHGIIYGEIKKLIAVIAEMALGGLSGLQTIGPHEFARLKVADHQVVAEGVKRVDIEARAIGSGQALVKFKVKNEVTKALAFYQVLRG